MNEDYPGEGKDREIARLRREVASLKDQLEIARAAASDQKFYRDQDRDAHDKVLLGYSMAIQSMMAGLKGGK